MSTRTVLVCALTLIIVAAPGCSRLARTAARSQRSYASSGRNTPPEELRIPFKDLDAQAVKTLNSHRAKWSEYVQKFDATETEGAAQVAAVMQGFINAHWSERPQPEDFARPLGVAIGDVLKREGNVNWVLAGGHTICLVSPTGKVAVAPVNIAKKWISAKSHPMGKLIDEVAKAVRETTGEPAQIGFLEDEDESDQDMV
ncbi:MAG: hypothetical protein Q8L55_07275 [Phycisphaerales bacterium]|nr:hypothetical protein [Phycisphaerales bacterium]